MLVINMDFLLFILKYLIRVFRKLDFCRKVVDFLNIIKWASIKDFYDTPKQNLRWCSIAKKIKTKNKCGSLLQSNTSGAKGQQWTVRQWQNCCWMVFKHDFNPLSGGRGHLTWFLWFKSLFFDLVFLVL